MKKFLTVLLALSVVFTYTVGTAFAATDPTTPTTGSQKTLDEAYDAAKTNLTAVKNAVVTKLADEYVEVIGCGDATHKGDKGLHVGVDNTFTLKIAKSVYTQIAEAVYKDYMSVLAIKYNELSKGNDESKTAEKLAEAVTNENAGTLKDKAYGDVDTEAEFKALVISDQKTDYYNKTLKLALNNYKETVKSELGKIDTSLYTTDVMDKEDPYAITYRQLAEETKAKWIAEAGDVTVSEDAETNVVIPALCKLNLMISANKITGENTYTNEKGEVVNVSYKFAKNAVTGYKGAPLLTKDELKGDTTTLEAQKAAAKAEVAAKAAAYYKEEVAKGTVAADAAKKLTDAYREVLNCRIDNMTSAQFTSYTVPEVTAKEGPKNDMSFEDTKAVYDNLKKEAATLKVLVDATGRLVYDSAKIDANLAKAMIEIYDGDNVFAAKEDLTYKAENKTEDVDWAKKVAIAQAEAARDKILYQADGTANYYELEQSKVVAKYAELIDKINAATTVAQIDAINKNVSLIGIKDKDATNIAVQGLSKFSTEYTKLENYVKYLNGDTKEWEDGYKAMMSREDLAKFYAKKGARTNDEIAALINDAKAECDAIKTSKEAKEAKKAVEDQVAALPAYITLAEKDAVVAAWNAADELGVTLDNQAKLDNAVAQLKAVELKAINDAMDALPSIDKITVANKDAVKAIVDAVKAYETNPMYKAGNKFAAYDKKATVDKYNEAVRDASRDEVVAAIAALPTDATKAQVEAVRKSYDAFVEAYTDAEAGYKAADKIANIDKLLYAEATLAAAEITAVEGLKITASSTAGKGYIKVKWTVKGDAAAADGFQVYRSVKKNSGFGTKPYFTTKAGATTYKNTKSLKKGKRYYYKVRAFKVVDGKNVYSDWSNKAYRIAK